MFVRKMLAFCISASLAAQPFTSAIAGNFSVIYSFNGGLDAGNPNGGLLNAGGTLYGTSLAGGGGTGCGYYCGALFKLTPPSPQSSVWTSTIVHAFSTENAGDGIPDASLISFKGLLYGSAASGGANGHGTVFSVDPGTGVESIVYSFKGGKDGDSPQSSLVNIGGSLYGTTFSGGTNSACTLTNGCGTVFKLTPSGHKWKETILYAFGGGSDGEGPLSGILDMNGILYGSTNGGGANATCVIGCGTIFSLTQGAGTTAWTENVVYSFTGATDGAYPYDNLIEVNGSILGTAMSGGDYTKCQQGCGTVFSVTPNPGGGAGTVTTIYEFKGGKDGAVPQGALLAVGASLLGTTSEGGLPATNAGTIFKLASPATQGALWKKTILHSFDVGEGSLPVGALIKVGGMLFGTTMIGGNTNSYCQQRCGTAFAITP